MVYSRPPHRIKNKRIGVIATERTITTGHHKEQLLNFDKNIKVFEKSCPKFVTLLENNGQLYELNDAIDEYLKPLLTEKIDTLILGCTHYAFLKDLIKNKAPHLKLISADTCVTNLVRIKQLPLEPEIEFFVSGSIEQFKKSLLLFFDEDGLHLIIKKFI